MTDNRQTPTAAFVIAELQSLANAERAAVQQRFFKTGKGEYAEGDKFLGVMVPLIRDLVKHAPPLPFNEIQTLLHSEWHEARLAGFLLLVRDFKRTKDAPTRKRIYEFYLKNLRYANNWDLVDIPCRDVIGAYLLDKPDERKVLYRLAASDNLWEQRTAMISTWTFIKHSDFADTLTLAENLLPHPHDLIHKAVGWMLREVGKKSRPTLVAFLNKHRHAMPRTALRYAIEHFSTDERNYFLK